MTASTAHPVPFSSRPASPAELAVWRAFRPSPLRWRSRSQFNRDFATGLVEVVQCSASRAWSFTECDPGCCEAAFLLELVASECPRLFLVLQSWRVPLTGSTGSLGSSIQAVRTPHTKRLLAVTYSGSPLPPHPRSLVEVHLSTPLPECEVLDFAELPSELQVALPEA